MAERILSAEQLREILHYDKETGVFTWRVNRGGRFGVAGQTAGCIGKNGRRRILTAGKANLAHRLAWLYVYGQWPTNHIDHINGNPDDNRIVNLRDVPRSTNLQNQRKAQVSNKSCGMLGVSKNGPPRNPWRAQIRFNGTTKYLGIFPTPELAHAAYIEAKRRLHPGCTI